MSVFATGPDRESPVGAFKAKLRRGEPVIVVNPDHPYPSLAAFLGRLSIDAVFIDCEQGSADVETVENLARATRLANLVSICRIFSDDDWVIERYLGRGIDGIVVPRLETAEQAGKVVEAVRYCYPQDHERKLVVVQIETAEALAQLDGFLAIEGIDAYFIGPVDLAKSLGFQGDFRNPAVQQVMADTIAAIHDAGKVSGILVDRGNVRQEAGRGVQFLYTHVNDFLEIGAADFVRLVQGQS